MVGDVGKMTGCMGNVVMALRQPNRLVRETVMKMEPFLRKVGYRGPFDINTIVCKDKLYALEMSCRFGYDAFEALMEGMQEPVGTFLFEVAVGIKKEMNVTYDPLIAVRISRDPYPACAPAQLDESDRGCPISGLNEENLKHLYLCDVYMENGKYLYAASDGILMKATAHGRDIREAIRRVYRTVKGVKIIDVQYRTDIGARCEGDIAKLKEWGWIL